MGDRVLAYVGAPDRVFVGEAVIESAVHEWSSDERARYPMTGIFGIGLGLSQPQIWEESVPLASVWSETQGAKTNPNALCIRGGHPCLRGGLRHDRCGVGQRATAGRCSGRRTSPRNRPRNPSGRRAFISGPGRRLRSRAVASSRLPRSSGISSATRSHSMRRAHARSSSTRSWTRLDIRASRTSNTARRCRRRLLARLRARWTASRRCAVEDEENRLASRPEENSQVVKYCSILGVRWGLLTTGRLWQVYDAPVTGVPPEDRLVFEVDLGDWVDREDFDLRVWPQMAMLTKDALVTGEALERIAARELIREVFERLAVTDVECASGRDCRRRR